MTLIIFIRHQIRLFLKSPNLLILVIAAPLFMIFIFGQAFSAIFSQAGSEISSRDYFGITLLTLAVFNGTFIASWGIYKEKKSNTEPRITAAPVNTGTVIFGTFLGTWIILTILSFLIILLASFVLSVNYGPSPGLPLLLISAETILAAAFGVCMAFLLQEKISNALLSIGVPLFVFLGGSYTMIPETGFLHDLSYFSPLRWINLALLEANKQGGNAYTLPALTFCGILSALFLGLTAIKLGRKK